MLVINLVPCLICESYAYLVIFQRVETSMNSFTNAVCKIVVDNYHLFEHLI